MIIGYWSRIWRLVWYIIMYIFMYIFVAYSHVPLIVNVLFVILYLLELVFFFDLFILDQHRLKIRFVLNPFKKDIIIPLDRIKEIILLQVGIGMARTGVKIYLKDDDKYISFMVDFSGRELDRLMKKVRSLGIEICDLNDQ